MEMIMILLVLGLIALLAWVLNMTHSLSKCEKRVKTLEEKNMLLVHALEKYFLEIHINSGKCLKWGDSVKLICSTQMHAKRYVLTVIEELPPKVEYSYGRFYINNTILCVDPKNGKTHKYPKTYLEKL